MKKFLTMLEALDAKAQALDARYWVPLMRQADRYARRGGHRAGKRGYRLEAAQRPAYDLIIDVRHQLNAWWDVYNREGIQAAIALSY